MLLNFEKLFNYKGVVRIDMLRQTFILLKNEYKHPFFVDIEYSYGNELALNNSTLVSGMSETAQGKGTDRDHAASRCHDKYEISKERTKATSRRRVKEEDSVRKTSAAQELLDRGANQFFEEEVAEATLSAPLFRQQDMFDPITFQETANSTFHAINTGRGTYQSNLMQLVIGI